MKANKHIIISAVLSAGLSVLSCFPASAGPARPYPVPFTQPDGTVIQLVFSGDEFNRKVTDLQGHAMIQREDGFYHQATHLEEQGLRKVSPRAAEARRIREERKSTLPRTKHCVVILAELRDIPLTYTREDIEAVFCEKGYSKNGATGSVSDYFNDQFGDQCTFEFVVAPQVKLPGTQKSYGENVNGGDKNPEQAVADACKAADKAGFDFSGFDDDGDGEVDCVFVILSGMDEADGGGSDAIWGHQYYIWAGAGIDLFLDGKRINTYTMCTELAVRQSTKETGVTTIGVLCHEYGHSFGLKDMYDTDGYSSGGYSNGLWATGVMDTGCYLNDGNTPAHYNAIDYDCVDCGICENLEPGSVELKPISQSRKFYKHEGAVKNEYYLIECRAKEGWDKYLGGSGVAIYHVDHSDNFCGNFDYYGPTKAHEAWYWDAVNNNPNHLCADIIEPTTSCRKASQAFYPYGTINSFTSGTTPSFTFWNGDPAAVAISNIELAKDGTASFQVDDAKQMFIPEFNDFLAEGFQTEVQITFSASMENYKGTALVEIIEAADGKTIYSSELSAYETGKYAARIDGLNPGTEYIVKSRFSYGGIQGDELQTRFSTHPLGAFAKDDEYSGPYIYCSKEGNSGSSPLVIMDMPENATVRWYFNDKSIYKSKGGYYLFRESGELKAVVTYSNGDTETLIKKIQ